MQLSITWLKKKVSVQTASSSVMDKVQALKIQLTFRMQLDRKDLTRFLLHIQT